MGFYTLEAEVSISVKCQFYVPLFSPLKLCWYYFWWCVLGPDFLILFFLGVLFICSQAAIRPFNLYLDFWQSMSYKNFRSCTPDFFQYTWVSFQFVTWIFSGLRYKSEKKKSETSIEKEGKIKKRRPQKIGKMRNKNHLKSVKI